MRLKRNVNTDEGVADAPHRYGVSWEKSTVERSSDVKGDCGRGGDGQERGRVALTPEGGGENRLRGGHQEHVKNSTAFLRSAQ